MTATLADKKVAIEKRLESTTSQTIPKYASACSNAAAYSSACSCIGVPPYTVVAPTPSTTITTSISCPTYSLTPEDCLLHIPSTCEFLNREGQRGKDIDLDQMIQCRDSFGSTELPFLSFSDEVLACLPAGIEESEQLTVENYNCLLALPFYCKPSNVPILACGLIDGGFENGKIVPWDLFDIFFLALNEIGFTFTVVTSPVHSGSRSLQAAFPNLNSALVQLRQPVRVVPQATYELSFWYRHEKKGSDCGAFLFTDLSEDANSLLSVNLTDVATDQWLQASANFTPFKTSGSVTMILYCNQLPVGGDNTLHIDDIVFTKVS
jgi:hypothetical protein